MEESIEQELARLVGNLSPAAYERYGPALQEAGLALAEFRQVQRDHEEALRVLRQALQDLDHAEERVNNAIRLLKGAE